jgi:hypothetical protein
VTDADVEAIHLDPAWRDQADFIIGARVDGDDLTDSEQLWARQLGDQTFEICCIPFFTYGLALGDVVETGADYTVKRVLKASGHHTYRVWFGESRRDRESVAEDLAALGALLEWSSAHLLAVDAANTEVAERIIAYLGEAAKHRRLEFEAGQ